MKSLIESNEADYNDLEVQKQSLETRLKESSHKLKASIAENSQLVCEENNLN